MVMGLFGSRHRCLSTGPQPQSHGSRKPLSGRLARGISRRSFFGVQIDELGQARDCGPGLLLGPCAAGFYPSRQRMAAIEDMGLGMAPADSPALPVERPQVGSDERLSSVPESRWPSAESCGRDEEADGDRTSPSEAFDTLPKGSGKLARTLGGIDTIRGRFTDPDGQQRLGTMRAGSGSGAEEFLRLRVAVERPTRGGGFFDLCHVVDVEA